MSSLLLFSCQKNNQQENEKSLVAVESRSFCSPGSGGSNCDPFQTHSIMLNVDGCDLKVNFKSIICYVGPVINRINIYDFSIDWVNSLRCNKIGLLNDSIPINGIGDWTPFFTLYDDLFLKVSNAAELYVMDFYGGAEQEDITLDFWQSHCQKACITPQVDVLEPDFPQIPQWTFHICSVDGCCFRQTIWTKNPITGKREIQGRNVTPGGKCKPEINVNCPNGSSPCREPCKGLI
jgi:hypothetical protein